MGTPLRSGRSIGQHWGGEAPLCHHFPVAPEIRWVSHSGSVVAVARTPRSRRWHQAADEREGVKRTLMALAIGQGNDADASPRMRSAARFHMTTIPSVPTMNTASSARARARRSTDSSTSRHARSAMRRSLRSQTLRAGHARSAPSRPHADRLKYALLDALRRKICSSTLHMGGIAPFQWFDFRRRWDSLGGRGIRAACGVARHQDRLLAPQPLPARTVAPHS
jgi:hypothetical protein